MRVLRIRHDPSPLIGRRRSGPFSALLLLVLAGLLAACGTASGFLDLIDGEEPVPPDSTLAYTVFVIGDAGAPPEKQEPNLRLLQTRLDSADRNSAILFLGDNIYPSGLPPVSSPYREDAESRIDTQIALVDSFAGTIVFVPGNHDWGGAGLGGDPDALLRQKDYVEAKLGRGNTYLPDGVFPGPAIVELADSITLVALDTQWWLEEEKYYGSTGQYFLEQEREFLLELDDVLRRYAHTNLLVAAHHPVFTNGPHGGFFETRRRLNPFHFFSRAYLGTPQDLSNYKYRRLRDGLLALFEPYDDLIFAAGHEHTLQYFAHRDQHHVVSGSGSKDSYVREGHGASFVYGKQGFGILNYYTDGSIWLEFWRPVDGGRRGDLLYRTRLREGNRPLVPYRPAADTTAQNTETTLLAAAPDTARAATLSAEADTAAAVTDPDLIRPEIVPDGTAPATNGHALPPTLAPGEAQLPYAFYDQGTITVRAVPEYADVGSFGRYFLGDQYRDAWAAAVEVPILDLARTAGGLTPMRRGGGLQTVGLHLQGGDGDTYTLRSINKDPGKTVPDYLLETFAHDVVQDQVSAMNPYGAFTLPRLARAAGILHTHPTLVYVPDDPRLGIYRDLFGGSLALFEARPDEEQRDEERFGAAENLIGTTKLFEQIEEDNDRYVDQRAFVRARLFDMLVGDWDRHSDQWRWAAYEPYELDPTLTGEARTQGKVYRPIPRDRDFAFFKFDGLLARIARNSGIEQFRRYTNFFRGYHDLYGLNFNGAPLDRRFTSEVTEAEWVAIAEDLKARLTDDVIEAAMRDFPPAVYDLYGEAIGTELRARRDDLPDAAARYYRILAHEADVVGSDKHERFEVTRVDDATTEVAMFKTLKEGDVERLLFRRTFHHDETDEVRLYGLGGNDTFVLRGDVDAGLLVRIVGGTGEDTFVDSSRVAGGSDETIIYDTPTGNTWLIGSETETEQSDEPEANAYRMLGLQRDRVGPVVLLGRDIDDGIEFGGGVSITAEGFRKEPYAAHHVAGVEYGMRSNALHASYDGHVVDYVGGWDARLSADYFGDSRFRNFYGLGNETNLEDRALYQASLGRVTLVPAVSRGFWPFMTLSAGPRLEYVSVDPLDDAPLTAFAPSDFTDRYFAGFEASFEIDGTDSLANTRAGARWLNEVRGLVGVRGTHQAHVRLASEASYFYTFDMRRQVTLAVRLGGAFNVGKFAFFHANTLGGEDNLRGFRQTRFAGRGSFYQNVDLRVQLFEFDTYLTRGDFGVLAFLDNGRVWADDDDSGRWHQGYGGGVWASPFYRLVVTATLARSYEDTLFDVSLGFLF